MVLRYRERILEDKSEVPKYEKYISSIFGTRTTDPGPADTLSSTYESPEVQTSWKKQEMNDVVTPGFKKLVARGAIINSPMDSYTVETQDTLPTFAWNLTQQVQWKYPTIPYKDYIHYLYKGNFSIQSLLVEGERFAPLPELEFDIDNMKDRAITKAWANIGHNEMLVGSSIVEAEKTVVGLRDILKQVIRLVRGVAKYKFAYLLQKESWKTMQEIYMNARYGLRPLAYDVCGMLNVLENLEIEQATRQTWRSGTEESAASNGTISKAFINHLGYGLTADFQMITMKSVKVRSGVLTECAPRSLNQLLGADKLFETAWDLIPFSFIVDWFANVGTTISAWVPDYGIKPLASWITVDETTVQLCTFTGMQETIAPGAYNYIPGGVTTGIGQLSQKTRIRSRIPDYERPFLPRFSVNLDPLKLLDLGIIATGIRKNARYL